LRLSKYGIDQFKGSVKDKTKAQIYERVGDAQPFAIIKVDSSRAWNQLAVLDFRH